MPDTYTLLQKVVVGAAGASSVSFTNIPQSYTDLKIVLSTRSTDGVIADNMQISMNGSSTGFTGRYVFTSAVSSPTSGTDTTPAGAYNGASATGSTFSNVEVYVPNYTANQNKSFSVDSVAENNAATANLYIDAKLWSNTAAITSVTFAPTAGSFVQHSSFYLYGVAKLGVTPTSAPKATGGDIIRTDGTYWYHTFLSSGTFTPKTSLTADYLVVAGGGGGGGFQEWGGGGGAGGVRCTVGATGGGGSLESALSLTAQAYTVTIGAGGAGKTTRGAGNNGSNSVFGSITATGGGGGGGLNAARTAIESPASGGSGGGGEVKSTGVTGSNSGAAGTSNQGYAGGNGYTSATVYNYSKGGGGGGAGAAGQNGEQGTASTSPSSPAGNGGNGVATSISGSSVTYGGGGGAGAYFSTITSTGGSGGGGNGGNSSTNGQNGTANTGGGGGANGTSSTGAGGSGIVIVRYAV